MKTFNDFMDEHFEYVDEEEIDERIGDKVGKKVALKVRAKRVGGKLVRVKDRKSQHAGMKMGPGGILTKQSAAVTMKKRLKGRMAAKKMAGKRNRMAAMAKRTKAATKRFGG